MESVLFINGAWYREIISIVALVQSSPISGMYLSRNAKDFWRISSSQFPVCQKSMETISIVALVQSSPIFWM